MYQVGFCVYHGFYLLWSPAIEHFLFCCGARVIRKSCNCAPPIYHLAAAILPCTCMCTPDHGTYRAYRGAPNSPTPFHSQESPFNSEGSSSMTRSPLTSSSKRSSSSFGNPHRVVRFTLYGWKPCCVPLALA